MSEARLEGVEALEKKIQELLKQFEPEKTQPILLEGAQTIRDSMKSKVPVKEGVLKKSIVAKLLKHAKGFAASLAGVDRRKGGYHAHLVEFGTSERFYKGASKGVMPRHPFIRPAIDENKEPVLNRIYDRLKALVDEVAK